MIKVGVVNIDTSHPMSFAGYMNQSSHARYTAIYNDGFRGQDEVDGFIQKFGVEKQCQSIEELAKITDIGFIQGCNWNKHLVQAKPFLDLGKPVFIDKPMVGNITDCLKVEKMAAEGKIILGSSSVRYCQEVMNFLSIPESDKGKTLTLYGTAGVDEFNYAIHIVEGLSALAGARALSCKYIGKSHADGCTSETYFVQYENGVTAVYNTCHGIWQPFEVVALTTKNTYSFRIDSGKLYASLLDRIFDFLESGKLMASVSEITDSIRIMLAGKISREQGGKTIHLSEIPEDDPGFDGDAFEKGYATAASKMYLL